MKKIEIKVPSLGESITEATVSKWFKNSGDHIEKDEMLVEIETDKVTQEIYALEAGTLSEIFFKEGKEVKIGDVLASIDLNSGNNTQISKTKKNTDNSLTKKINLIVPSLGESITDVVIGKWLIKEGKSIKKGEPIVEVETDKVTQELYAEEDSLLKKILFEEEKEAKIGDIIGILEATEEVSYEKDERNNVEIEEKIITEEFNKDLDPTSIRRSGLGNKIRLDDLQEFIENKTFSPAARKYLKEHDLDIRNAHQIKGKDRISKSDILDDGLEKKKHKESKISSKDKNNNKEIIKPLSNLRKSIAKKLKDAQNNAAMLTTFNEIDMHKVIKIRKEYKEEFLNKYNVKLGFMSFFTKASIAVLREIPEINAEVRNDNIIYKNRYDIGIAVGTEKGLYVPVLRNADNMSFAQIEEKILEYGKLAKENKITLDQMSDGTFTISNGGVYGSMLSTPILNPPQSGILGLHNIVKRPVVIEDQILIRPIMYIALTYDHRIIDGKQAVTFLVRLKEIIENPEKMILDL